MGGYLVVFAVASLVTFGFTPIVRRIAFRVGALYQPSERTVHTKPMPTVGGAAMFVGFLVSMGVASQIPQFQQMFDGSSEPAGVVLAAGVMFAVGALDDLREVSPPAKIAGQVLSGSILSLMGVSMLFFRVPFFGIVVLSPDLAPLVTVLTVVLFANAINLVDGLDGLAAGIVAIAGTAVFLYSHSLFENGFLTGSNIAPLIAMIAVGICIGFLPWNFSPARIFMGDAGAMLLGLLMAVTTITIGGRADYEYSRADVLLLCAAVHPDRDPRCPAARHRVLVLPALAPSSVVRGRRQGPPPPSTHAARPRAPTHGGDPLAVDGAALEARPAPALHERGERVRTGRHPRARSRAASPVFAPGARWAVGSRHATDGPDGVSADGEELDGEVISLDDRRRDIG